MKTVYVFGVVLFLCSGTVSAQSVQPPNLPYSFAELRFLDVDIAGGDGFKLGGSYRFDNNWLLVGSLANLSFNGDVDSFTLEIGGGYVWAWQDDWDLVGSIRFTDVSVDTPFGDVDDDGFIVEGGVRGLLAPKFEIRGSVNHITVGDSDTYLEFGGDYHFTENLAAGLTFEFAGDVDVFTIGARWFFR